MQQLLADFEEAADTLSGVVRSFPAQQVTIPVGRLLLAIEEYAAINLRIKEMAVQAIMRQRSREQAKALGIWVP